MKAGKEIWDLLQRIDTDNISLGWFEVYVDGMIMPQYRQTQMSFYYLEGTGAVYVCTRNGDWQAFDFHDFSEIFIPSFAQFFVIGEGLKLNVLFDMDKSYATLVPMAHEQKIAYCEHYDECKIVGYAGSDCFVADGDICYKIENANRILGVETDLPPGEIVSFTMHSNSSVRELLETLYQS